MDFTKKDYETALKVVSEYSEGMLTMALELIIKPYKDEEHDFMIRAVIDAYACLSVENMILNTLNSFELA